MHAGASLASGGLDAKDAIAIGRLRQPNSVLVKTAELSSVTHHTFIDMNVHDHVMDYRATFRSLNEKHWYPDHLDPSHGWAIKGMGW